MMKKRNDEGFALAYVVVVIFILCSIAIALMSSTLRTLQAQENMVQRMKDKYEAMGEIERVVAAIQEYSYSHSSDQTITESNESSYLCTRNHDQSRVDDFVAYIGTLKKAEQVEISYDENNSCIDISVTLAGNSICVQSSVVVIPSASTGSSCQVNTSGPDAEFMYYTHNISHHYSYSIDKIEFIAYDIFSVDNSPESDGGSA